MLQRHAQLTGHNGALYALAGRGDTLLSGGGDGWLVQWDYATPELGKVMAKIEGRVFSFHAFAERPLVVAGDMEGGVRWIDLTDAARNRNVAHHRQGVFAIRHRDAAVYTVGGEGRLTKWSVATQRTVESLQLSGQALRSLAIHPTLAEAAVGSSDGNVYVVQLDDFRLRQTLDSAHANSVFSLVYSPDGQYLYSGGRDAQLQQWSVWDSYQNIRQIPAHLTTINDLVLSPDGRFLASAGRDKTVKIWDAADLALLKVLEGVRDRGHFNSVNALAWTDRGLFSTGDDRTVIWWTQSSAASPDR